MSMIEVAAPSGVSRFFIPSGTLTNVASLDNGDSTFRVSVTFPGGSSTLASGMTQAEADRLAEEIVTAIGLDWKLP